MNNGIPLAPLLLASGGIGSAVTAVAAVGAGGGVPVAGANLTAAPPGFLGAIFNRRERKLSKSDESGSNVSSTVSIQPTSIDRSTEV